MGMNMILTLIAGIVMTTMVGTQVAPSIIDQIKVKKTQVQTINNQEVIFEAIKRYTTIKQVAPTSITQLIDEEYIDTKVNDNGFGVEHIIDSEKYTIHVDKALGVATITTTIVDPKAQEAFLNSFMGTSKPSCKVDIDEDGICDTNEFETKYVLPNEVMHGNALLMTGIPIQATPPDSNINRYWYDTSSGKATLKIYDNDSSSWIEVNLGSSSDEMFLPGNYKVLQLPTFIDKIGGKETKAYEIIPSKSGAFLLKYLILNSDKNNASVKIYINGVRHSYLVECNTNYVELKYCPDQVVAFKANDKIAIHFYRPKESLAYISTINSFRIYISPDTNYPISYTKFDDVTK